MSKKFSISFDSLPSRYKLQETIAKDLKYHNKYSFHPSCELAYLGSEEKDDDIPRIQHYLAGEMYELYYCTPDDSDGATKDFLFIFNNSFLLLEFQEIEEDETVNHGLKTDYFNTYLEPYYEKYCYPKITDGFYYLAKGKKFNLNSPM